MAYKVIITDQAQQDFAGILAYPHSKFSPAERMAYVGAIQARCFGLEYMPKRFRPEWFDGVEYRLLTYKAHLIVYQVDDTSRIVSVVTIRGSRMKGLTKPVED